MVSKQDFLLPLAGVRIENVEMLVGGNFWRSSLTQPPAGGRGREKGEKMALGNPGRGKKKQQLIERY